MRYDSGYDRSGMGRRSNIRPSAPGRPAEDTRDDPFNRSFRGQPVDDVHTAHPGERGGYAERGDFVTRPARGGYVDPRANMYPHAGETDFLGRPYAGASFDAFPRGLYDQDYRQAGYDRNYGARGYDRGMRATARYDRDFGGTGRMPAYDQVFRGPRPRGHGGGMGYGQDYEAVRRRSVGGPMMGHARPGEPLRPLGEPTWTNRWSRRR